MKTRKPAKRASDPLTWDKVLTASEKRRRLQGLPLLPRPDMRDLLKYAGTIPDEAIMTNDEIEGLEHHG